MGVSLSSRYPCSPLGLAYRGTTQKERCLSPPTWSLCMQRLVFYCRETSASTASCTSRRMCSPAHCASCCAPCQPLLRAFSGWIRSPPPTSCRTLPGLFKAPPWPFSHHKSTTLYRSPGKSTDRCNLYELISHNVLIKWFQKVNFPTKSPTYLSTSNRKQ